MKIIVNPHDIKIDKTDIVNEGEYHITQLNFEFSKEYTDDLVKKAIFIGNDNKAYEMVIDNNICNIPSEILVKQQSVFLGVYAYKITGSELVLRYSPSPVIFPVIDGSYRQDSVPSEEITPSQFEQYQQALQNGLSEVNAKLQEVINTSETVKENGTYAKEQGDYAKETTDELVSKAENGDFDGATFTPSVDAEGNISWSNDKGLDNPQTQNIKGQKGDTGEPFTISKTYPSVEAMNADFDNMEVGDYVMIASSVNDEDNAKLYVKTDTEWVFITDFSGAIGIQGEPGVGITTVTSGQSIQQDGNTVTPITVNKTDGTQQTFNVSAKNGIDGINGTDGNDGVTPNLQVGTVTTLEPNEHATVTRTGTDEQPVFNFGIPQGQQGEQGIPGQDGQPGQDGADGKDATINGQNTVEITTDNTITLEQQENILKLGLNSQLIPKQDAEGTYNVFDDGLESPLYALRGDGESQQTVTQGYNLCNGINQSYYLNNNTTLCGVMQGDSGLIIETNGIENYTVSTKINQERYRVACSNSLPTGSGTQEVTVYNGVNKDNTSDDITINTSGYSYLIVNATDLSSIQIVEGATAKPYEPYTNGIPSPSPDYEQPINSVEGSLEFACSGRNLLPNNASSQTINDVIFIVKDDGSVIVNGTAPARVNLFLFTNNENPIKLIPGNYSLNSGKTSGASFLQIEVKNLLGESRYITSSNTPNNNVVINEGDVLVAGYIGLDQGQTATNDHIYPVFQKGATSTKYEPYIEPNQVTFNLGQEKLRSVGDVKDELVVDLDTGDYYKLKNIEHLELAISNMDNTENYPGWRNVEKINEYYPNVNNTIGDIIQFKSNITINRYSIGLNTVAQSSIWLGKGKFNLTQTQWKEQYPDLVFKLDYSIPSTETIKLGTLSAEDLAKLKTFKGYNNVTVNTNLGLINIRFTYGLDIKKYVDNKIAQLSEQLIKGE